MSTNPCHSITNLMKDFPHPWAIAGGWAIDLFLSQQTRPHSDIEILIFRRDQFALQTYLTDWQFTCVENRAIRPWLKKEKLSLPIHEAYAEKDGVPLEILLNEADKHHWIYRRDTRIKHTLNETINITSEGIPYLSPEIALLYKSTHLRAKDEADFHHATKKMSLHQIQWLKESLLTMDEAHPWISLLH
ncbi:hypothetical protein NSQ26_11880 [Bacillus sp. FSL W7-1360]